MLFSCSDMVITCRKLFQVSQSTMGDWKSSMVNCTVCLVFIRRVRTDPISHLTLRPGPWQTLRFYGGTLGTARLRLCNSGKDDADVQISQCMFVIFFPVSLIWTSLLLFVKLVFTLALMYAQENYLFPKIVTCSHKLTYFYKIITCSYKIIAGFHVMSHMPH